MRNVFHDTHRSASWRLAWLLGCLLAPLAHAAGGPGNALNFNDTSGSATVAHTSALNAFPLTVTTWFQVQPGPPLSVDFVKKHDGAANGWRLRLLNNILSADYTRSGASYVGTGSGLNGGLIADGLWHQAALMVDVTGGRLYLDGVLVDSKTWTGTVAPTTPTQDLLLGGYSGPPVLVNFALDEVTVWNVALSQTQIQTNKNRSLTGAESGLLAYYRCDEVSGSTLADSAPAVGTNTGSLTGPYFFTSSGILPFTPYVETVGGTALNPTTAQLQGVANPESTNTAAWFQWGTTTNYGNTTPLIALGNGVVNSNLAALFNGLTPGVTYQFRATASNALGVSFGTNQSFTAPTFAPINAGLPGVGDSATAWGDYDNDGQLDILLTGATNLNGDSGIAQVWRNTGGGFTNINAGLPDAGFGSVAWGDYDNDGRLDIFLTSTIYGTKVLRNTVSGFTNVNMSFPFASPSSVAWGDYDNDGRLDILLTGTLDNPHNLAIAQVWRNFTPQTNTPPTAPTGLTVNLTNSLLTLTWNAASDSQTPSAGLTYNLRVGTTPGGVDVATPMSASSGFRLVPETGNRQHTRVWSSATLPVNVPLYLSMQAVDTAFAGSPFATVSLRLAQAPPILTTITTTNLAPGDLNGDGVVDQNELNLVLGNYFPSSPFLQMTNVAGLGGSNVTFTLTNATATAFSVEVTTNLGDWQFLGPATPRYLFTDTNAPAGPQRYYRLRWP